MIEWRTERKFLERVFRTLHVEGATNHGSTLDGYLVMKWDSSERTFEWAGTWLVRPVHKEGIEELKGARWNAVHWKFCFLTCLIGARLDLLLIVVLQWLLFHSFIVCMPRVHCMLYYLISLCFMRIAALIIWNFSHEVFSGIEDIYTFFFDLNVMFRILKIYRPARPSCYAQANFTSVPECKFALVINFTQRRLCEQVCLFIRAMWRSLIHT